MNLPALIDLGERIARELELRKQRDSPLPFCEFVGRLGVTLTPGQRSVGRVMYERALPCELPPVEQEIALRVFGDVREVPAMARSVIAFVVGRGSGKSRIFCAARLLQVGLTHDLSRLAPGEPGYGAIVAPSMKLARQTLRFLASFVERDVDLARLVVTSNADSLTLLRPDGQTIIFECFAASARGQEMRGRSFFGAVLDEVAIFRDEAFQVSDVEIFAAIRPRLLPAGQILLASTPWARKGLLWELHEQNHGHPVTALAAQASTLDMRDDDETRATVAQETARDPENAAREFGAQFISSGTTVFFDPTAIDAAIDRSLVLPLKPAPGTEVSFGGDFGFRSDSSALVGVHRVGGKHIVGELVELRPLADLPLKPSETVRTFAERIIEHSATSIMADRHYREAIDELLLKHDLAFLDAPNTPSDAYIRARTLFREGSVRLPNHPRLLRQLREVIGRPLPGGGVQIIQPRWRTGGHGDIVSALVLALYQSGGESVPQPGPEPGTAEADEEARLAARMARVQQDSGKPWWSKKRAG